MKFLGLFVVSVFSILTESSRALVPFDHKKDVKQAKIYGKCVKITEMFFYFIKLKTTFVCPPSFLDTENNRNLLGMTEDDHLIIKNDFEQVRFYGKFDVEFINILRKGQCYRRTCKVKQQESELKNRTSLSYYDCHCCPVLKSLVANSSDCQTIKRTIHREFDLIEDMIDVIDPSRLNCTTTNKMEVDNYYRNGKSRKIRNLICNPENPALVKNSVLS